MSCEERGARAPLLRKSFVVATVILMGLMGISLISTVSEATVTPANPVALVASNQGIHDNSTAVPIWGFRAVSNTGTDTLDSVNVSMLNLGQFTLSDLRPITTNMRTSGIALYRDNGTSDDSLDPSDGPLTVSSIMRTSLSIRFNISSETVPTSTSGSHHWFVVIRTSSTITASDTFASRLEPNAIRFSDSTTIPSSRITSNSLRCSFAASSYIGVSDPVPIGEAGVTGDTIPVQGITISSGISDLEVISKITVKLHGISGFDPTVDLAPISTGSGSGIKLYIDDSSPASDGFDRSLDTLVVPSSVSTSSSGGVLTATLNLFTSGPNRVKVPGTTSGNIDYFVVLTTSADIGNGNRFYTSTPSLGLEVKGVDGNRANVMPNSNRSRTIEADTRAPSLAGADLRIFSDRAYFYEKDTDLQGRDEIFFNSITGEGLGQRISVTFSSVDEKYPERLIGEPALGSLPNSPVDETDSTRQTVSYDVDATSYVDNPLTFTLVDKVGHATEWDVYFTKDNKPPVVSNVSLIENSKFMYTDQPTRNIYFRPSMLFTDNFHITGNAYEPDNESGLLRASFTYESSLESSPPDDNTPASWNGSYGVNSRAQDSDSPLYVRLYDRVLNDWIMDFSYHRVVTLPKIEIQTPSSTGLNVSGIYRVVARVDSDAPMEKMEFGYDDDPDYEQMTFTGNVGGWGVYIYDWDTFDAGEGSHTIKIKGTDVTSGVNYNTTWVNVNNYPLWGYYVNPTWNQPINGQIEVRMAVSSYLSGARFYVSDQLIGSWTGKPSAGNIWTTLNTALFTDGKYIIKATLAGFGGRGIDVSIPITIDNSAPIFQNPVVVYPGTQEAAKVGDKVRFRATIYDNTSGLDDTFVVANSIGGSVNQILFDDGSHNDGSPGDKLYGSDLVTVDATWGFHIVRFIVKDNAGNIVEKKVQVPVDPKPPYVEDAWIKYPGEQGAAKTGDSIQVMAEISDNTAPIYITLVLDNSGSMTEKVNGVEKIDQLKKAAKTFINSTRDIDYISLWRFYGDTEDPHPRETRPGWPKKILNFTLMDDKGKAQARNLIDGIIANAGTPIWDTIGNATKYTIDTADSNPVVVAFTDGADNYFYERHNTFEEGSALFAPWHDWDVTRWVTWHLGKYEDIGAVYDDDGYIESFNESGHYYWVNSPIYEDRQGLLNAPIPIYTIGLGLEHHDPPNQPRRTTAPSNYEYDSKNATYTGETGTTEFNLWRIATTSAGGAYYYAPSATQLETIFRNIAKSIYSTDNPAKVVRAVANVPLDVTKQVLLFDDGLHNDGLADDGLYGSVEVTIPTLPSETRVVLIEAYDWAANIGLGDADLIIDNILPEVDTPVIVHYPQGRSSVGDEEPFHLEITAWDKGSSIFTVKADGTGIGFFPPITFNNTGEGNDVDGTDMNYTSINIIPNTGGAPSKYYFVEVIVTDQAGNSIKALAQVLVVNDKEAPVIEMLNPELVNGALSGKDRISAIVTDDGVIRTVRYSIYQGSSGEVMKGFLKYTTADIYEVAVDVSSLDDGDYFLEVKANDTAGRVGTTGAYMIRIDNTDPILKLNYPVNNSAVSGDVSILYFVQDIKPDEVTVTFSIDGGPQLDADEGFSTTGYSHGLHLVQFRAVDPAGNMDTRLLYLFFDGGEDITLVSPSSVSVQEGVIDILAKVEDGAGIRYVEAQLYEWGNRSSPTPPAAWESPFASLRLSGPQQQVVTSGTFEGLIDSRALLDGEYLLVIYAMDRLDYPNMEMSYLPIDNNAPELNVISPIDGGPVSGNFTPEVEIIEPFLARSYFTFGGDDHPLGTTLDLRSVPDGRYTMKFVALDTSLRSTIVELDVFVDRSKPIVEIRSPGDRTNHTGTLTVLASVRENSGLRYVYLDMDGYTVAIGTPIGPGGLYSFVVNLTSFDRREHIIQVKAENMAGMVGESDTRRVYKDYLDTDGDGVLDMFDDAPFDPTYSGDIDGDGFGSFYDDDSDGDGIPDDFEPEGESYSPTGVSKGVTFRMDPTEWLDTNGDGIGDNSDPDIDGDGIPNERDAFPLDISEWGDMDGDGIGDNTDPDIDGDGVFNDRDELERDPLEWKDTDGDGIGDNRDDDDDNDGVPDDKDDYPGNPNRQYNWWPVLFISFVALMCVLILFAGMVFRERIDTGVQKLVQSMRNPPQKPEKGVEHREPAPVYRPPQPPKKATVKHIPEAPKDDRPRPARKIPPSQEDDKARAKPFKAMEEEKEGFKVKWG